MRTLWAVIVVVVLLPMAAWAVTSIPVTSTVNVTVQLISTAPASTTGVVNAPSGNFTVTLDGLSFNGSQSVTITDNQSGSNRGTISPSGFSTGVGSVTVTPLTGNSFTFTYTPVIVGTITLTFSNAQGWTENPVMLTYTSRSATGTTYFISGIGSDSNDGLAGTTGGGHGPFATCAHLSTISFFGGDTLAFDAANPVTINSPTLSNTCNFFGPQVGSNFTASGGVFTSYGPQNVFNTSGSAPFTITSYGGTGSCNPIAGQTGTCGKINVTGTINTSGVVTGIVNVSNLNWVTVQNLVITNTVGAPPNISPTSTVTGHTAGIAFTATGYSYAAPPGAANNTANYTITNNKTVEFTLGIEINGQFGFQSQGRVCGPGMISNNLAVGNSSTSNAVDGILTFQLGDYCPTPTTFVQGNLVFNMGGGSNQGGAQGNGILLSQGTNGVINQFNVTHDIGANNTLCGGPAGNWVFFNNDGASATPVGDIFQFNESYHVRPTVVNSGVVGCDWAGFDFDTSIANSIYQYNYSHDNYGAGFLMFMGTNSGFPWTNNYVRYNISYNDATGNEGPLTTSFNAPAGLFYFHNNTVVNPTGTTTSTAGGANSPIQSVQLNSCPASGTVIANNIFALATNNGAGSLPFQNFNEFVFMVPAFCTGIIWGANDWFQITTGSGPRWIWSNNATNCTSLSCWQATATNGDAGATTANPGITTSSDVTCYPGGVVPAGPQNQPAGCPSWASTGLSSAVKNTGVNVTNSPYNVPTSTYAAPTHDYFGNSVPNTSGHYNMGAYGGN